MKKKMYCVSLTDGIYREVLRSISFKTEKEADAAFEFACSLDNSLPFDVELKSYNKDTKTNQTSMWDSLRFRKYFNNAYEREVFDYVCHFAHSKMYLMQKAINNNENPYETVCGFIKDEFCFKDISIKKRGEIAEAVCNFYGITI